MNLFRCIDAMFCEQGNIFFVYQMRDCIGSVFQIQQTSSFCFMYPFVRIVIAVENNPFVFDYNIADDFFCLRHYIFRAFQLVGNVTDSIGSDSIHNGIGIGNRRSRTQHTELKFIPGKCKRRSTVAVTSIFLETWHSSNPGFHLLTGNRHIFQTVFIRFQNIA